MKVSVITSSMARKETLGRLFLNLENQTRQPDEIIVIEAGGANWALSEAPESLRDGLRFLYAKGESLAASRYRGQQAATGDILFFCDDDIILPPDYIQNAVDYLNANPAIMAVGGTYVDAAAPNRNDGSHLMAQLMGVHGNGESNRLLISGWTDFVRGKYAREITSAEWLFGGDFVVRSSAFPRAQFQTHMAAWSFLEDVFFGLSLKNSYGDCMRILPTLRVIHDPPTSGGKISPATLRMRVLYRYILWREHVAKTRASRFMFGLGMLANLLLMIKQERRFWVVPESLKSLVFIIKNPLMTWENANEFIFSKH